MSAGEQVLVTGATGFVGDQVVPALEAAGYAVRCATRDPGAARPRDPARTWVRLDVDDPASLAPALDGCASAIYLVHGMGGGGDYPGRERAAADAFRDAAAAAGLRRIVYLGGTAPAGPPSRHLASRLETGERLRAGPVSAIELRAAMVIGPGSASWRIVRNLAARLPAMVLPAWLEHASCPVGVDDVVAAILGALELPEAGSAWFDAPGPERLTHRQVIAVAAVLLGRRPAMLDVPLVTPRLSSYWISLVTGVELGLVRELVDGLQSDLLPTGPSIWDRIRRAPSSAAVAMQRALNAERAAPVAG